MKSVIQEGSTLAKAIEQGWIKAGKPREFTVKIFQDSQKNFFGMTTIQAKVGIFFKDGAMEVKQSITQREHKPRQHYKQRTKYYGQQKHQAKRYPKHKDQYRAQSSYAKASEDKQEKRDQQAHKPDKEENS